MARHVGPVSVRFHGGFLDGLTTHSADPATEGIRGYWNAARFYSVTLGEIGAYMSGVSPEGLQSMVAPSDSAPTVVLHHRYRVFQCRIEDGVLIIDASYEFVVD